MMNLSDEIDYWLEQRYDDASYGWENSGYVPTYSGARVPRERARSGDEWDALDPHWRQMYCYTQRAGVTAKIKRAIRRRERHNWKKDLSW